jgi:hypothetical protein
MFAFVLVLLVSITICDASSCLVCTSCIKNPQSSGCKGVDTKQCASLCVAAQPTAAQKMENSVPTSATSSSHGMTWIALVLGTTIMFRWQRRFLDAQDAQRRKTLMEPLLSDTKTIEEKASIAETILNKYGASLTDEEREHCLNTIQGFVSTVEAGASDAKDNYISSFRELNSKISTTNGGAPSSHVLMIQDDDEDESQDEETRATTMEVGKVLCDDDSGTRFARTDVIATLDIMSQNVDALTLTFDDYCKQNNREPNDLILTAYEIRRQGDRELMVQCFKNVRNNFMELEKRKERRELEEWRLKQMLEQSKQQHDQMMMHKKGREFEDMARYIAIVSSGLCAYLMADSHLNRCQFIVSLPFSFWVLSYTGKWSCLWYQIPILILSLLYQKLLVIGAAILIVSYPSIRMQLALVFVSYTSPQLVLTFIGTTRLRLLYSLWLLIAIVCISLSWYTWS